MYRPDQGFHPETDSRIGPDPEVDYEAREDGGETDALHDPDLARHIHRGLHGPDSSVETIGATLPAHENAPDDPPNPWEDAARELRVRIDRATAGIDHEISRLATPGCAREKDLADLERFAVDLERAVSSGRFSNDIREIRIAVERTRLSSHDRT